MGRYDLNAVFSLDVRGALRAFQQVQKAADKTEKELKEVDNASVNMSGNFDKFAASMRGLGLALGVTMGTRELIQFSKESLIAASTVEGLRLGLQRLGSESGTNTDIILRDMAKVAQGTLSEQTVLTNVNRAIRLGGVELASAMPQLTAIARRAAVDMGESFDYMLNSIVLGIARGSPKILDNLGILIDTGEANKQFASSLGIAVDALTEKQKMVLSLNQILRDYGQNVDDVAAIELISSEQLKTGAAAIEDFKVAWGELLIALKVPGFIAHAADMIQFELAYAEMAGEISDVTTLFDDYSAALLMTGQRNAEYEATLIQQALAEKAHQAALEGDTEAVRHYREAVIALIGTNKVLTQQTTAWASQWAPKATEQTTAWAEAMAELGDAMGWVARQGSMTGMSNIFGSPLFSEGGNLGNEFQSIIDSLDDPIWTFDEWRAQAEASGREAASSFASGYSSLVGDIQSAVMSGLEVKESDFTGDYLDAPLEAVRRLRDIANLGLESPWAKMFEIPPEVLQQGPEAIKRWAAAMADRGAEMRDISLIDKDAFLRELEEIQVAAEEKENVLNTLMKWAQEAGLSEVEAKTYAQKMVGEPSAEGVIAGLSKIGDLGAGTAMAESIKKSVIKAWDDYVKAGKTMGKPLLAGILEYIKENPLVIPVSLSGVPPVPGGLGDVSYDGGRK